MDSASEYEYEDDVNEDEEYNYEDDEEDDNSISDSNHPSHEQTDKLSTPLSRSLENNRDSLGPPLIPSNKKSPLDRNPLIRENSHSYELVVPIDSYVIRPLTDIAPLLTALVNEVSTLLDISEDEAQGILQYFKWDKEKMMDGYFSNSEKVRKSCGLDLFSLDLCNQVLPPPLTSTPVVASAKLITCRICYDEVDISETFALGCKHAFCRNCFSEYLRSAVSDGASCVSAHCPEHKCKQLITKTIVHGLLGPEDSAKYDLFFIRDFIEKSKNMKYCPAPRCEKVAVGSGITTVRCSCNYCFCFKCGEEAHDPCSCAQLSEWIEKCMNESETANWILANTRKCPQCTTRIEKNQGCNHMTCKICKYEFCWICMGNWQEHGQNTGGFYKCNRYDPSEVSSTVSAAQKAKQELDRYLHYYQRYHGHDQGLKYASKQREAAEAKMIEQQQQKGSSWMDVQFLYQAAEQVIDCRRVLKYTYCLGFFLLDGTPEKKLFEYQQEMLEKNVEKLHEYTEKPVLQVDRTQVVNLTRVTEKFLASLLQSMTGGIVRLDETSLQTMNYDAATSSKEGVEDLTSQASEK